MDSNAEVHLILDTNAGFEESNVCQWFKKYVLPFLLKLTKTIHFITKYFTYTF